MMFREFESTAHQFPTELRFPEFSGTRIMMMPFVIGGTLLRLAPQYQDMLEKLSEHIDEFTGQTGYLTIDESIVYAGKTLRRPGLHVDGVYNGSAGSWGGGGGSWGGGGKKNPNDGNGMLLASSTPHCRFYTGIFSGEIGDDGECDSIDVSDARVSTIEPNRPYWCNPLCVHESLPVLIDTPRQFIRISLPSTAPWFKGYTENPDGVPPTGPVLPERTKYMESSAHSG
tara:strand:- start:1997 stop:2680 length:684 start_codon:yes stop_codon:yes gene_type:complete